MNNLKAKRDLDNPAVYCGTYAKYNNGSLFGEWIDLTQFADECAFYDYCIELHKDEADPELMFQDFENFPKAFYSECSVSAELYEWINMDSDDQELLKAAQECLSYDITLDQAQDSFCGIYDSEIEYAYEYVDSTGMFGDCPESVSSYFDYDSFARDLFMDMARNDNTGHVFNLNY